jgi:hypothetical protein
LQKNKILLGKSNMGSSLPQIFKGREKGRFTTVHIPTQVENLIIPNLDPIINGLEINFFLWP